MVIQHAALRDAVDEVFARHKNATGGSVAAYIPELARVDPAQFGLAICSVDGYLASTGDDRQAFSIQSISKPFVYALALSQLGVDAVHKKVGVEPTGDAFDSIIRLEEETNRPHNPMVNAGAIAVTSLIQGGDRAERLSRILGVIGAFAGEKRIAIDAPVYLSERGSGHRNRAIAYLMRHFGMIAGDVEEALELYFQQCAALVDVRALAVMGATLAAGGKNPVTGEVVISRDLARQVLTLMSSCGLYDSSGSFLLRTGLMGKSGVSGGVVAVAKGGLGIAAWSPALDEGGNSVRGVAAVAEIAERLSLHLYGDPSSSRSPFIVRDTVVAHDPMEVIEDARRSARLVDGGRVANYVDELASADPSLLGIAMVSADGDGEWVTGDADHAFTIQSAVNPIGYALALQARGIVDVHTRVGMEASGNLYNAIRFDPRTHRPYNPMVNAGAIAVCSMVPGVDSAERLQRVLRAVALCAGVREVHVDVPVLMAERAAGDRNHAIACLLQNFGLIDNPEVSLELFLASCSIQVTARQLARIAATLANRGRCPITGVEVFEPRHVERVLAMMTTCGLNNGSGRFAFEVGLPAKSGISGGILAVAPGRYGMAVFSPPVDRHGNSVRGVHALRSIAKKLDLSVFAPPVIDRIEVD